VEINGQAARKSDISQKESEALTGLLILRNGHVCDSRNDMSNRNGYDFYCVSDISGIHGNTCDSRNDKSVWSKQEWPRIDDMSDENHAVYGFIEKVLRELNSTEIYINFLFRTTGV
jgi:hypothetical protein